VPPAARHFPDAPGEMRERLRGLAALVAGQLREDWRGADPLTEVAAYAVSAPGKLLRPLLLLESAASVGGDVHRVLPAAAGTEGAHVASLIHDDIIDGDLWRRGRPAVHVRFGRDRAIVGGDALIFSLFQSLGRCAALGVPPSRIVDAMDVAARAGADLCRGQLLEDDIRVRDDWRLSSYLAMIDGKTGALFGASCRIGGILGGGSPAQADALSEFGTALDRAFQIRDDVLPYVSTAVTMGKSPESDLANRRLTLPILVCRNAVAPATRARLEELMNGPEQIEARHAALIALLHETGAIDVATEMGVRYAQRALDALAPLETSAARATLAYFADAAVRRWS
jgi:geranylgeranyl pyrophosphate synthase